MSDINWAMINNGGAFESLMHAIVFAEDATTILFGRPGKDSGQDARSADGTHVYQAKYRTGLKMTEAVTLALEELKNIKKYKKPGHANYKHWQNANQWTLVANLSINPNDLAKWDVVVQAFQQEGFQKVEYWGLEKIEQKLIQHPEICDAFFAGNNRTMVGLREAYEWLRLTSPGSDFINAEYIGHADLFERVRSFSASSKRVLTVVGDHCSGLSRFLYEIMNMLSDSGKRVYWGLPREMVGTSDWFKYIRSSNETYVIIDDLDSRDLVDRILGQLASAECLSWKMILASHAENRKALQAIYAMDKKLSDEIVLSPLTKDEIGILATKYVSRRDNLPSAEILFTLTQGFPGWLALLLQASVRYNVARLTINDSISEIVERVKDECLKHIPEGDRVIAQGLLRWIALWDVLTISEQSLETPEIEFLRKEIGEGFDILAILRLLVGSGIMHNWGAGKRCFAVEPSIVRQEILRDWLLQKDERGYVLNNEGYSLVKKMIRGEIPRVDAVLRSVSNIAISYMGRIQTKVALNPVFDAFTEEAKNGTIFEQASIIELLKNVGWAHPDRALEVLSAIRKNPKEAQSIHNRFYGELTIDSKEILSDVAEYIFQYGGCVVSESMARRYLLEIAELFKLEEKGELTIKWRSSGEAKLLKLMQNSEVAEYYIPVGYDILCENINKLPSSNFCKASAKAILSPERENDIWTRYSFSMNRSVIRPESMQWNLMLKLRRKLFIRLLCKDNSRDRIAFWRVLVDSHHNLFHVATSGGVFPEKLCEDYMSLVRQDLKRVLCVSRKHGMLSLAEFTAAREMWSWYVAYGQIEKHPVLLAKRCEEIEYENADWDFQNFFAFTTSKNAAPAIDRVEQKLKRCSTIEEWKTFFDRAKQYLHIARGERGDLADGMRMSDLALRFVNDFHPLTCDNLISKVVQSILSATGEDSLEIRFAIQLCQYAIKTAKTNNQPELLAKVLKELMKWSRDPARFLWYVYADSHPLSVGGLSITELNIVKEQIKGLSLRETVTLLAQFVGIGQGIILANMEAILKGLDNENASQCMFWFISALWLSFLRYGYRGELIPITWIFSQINELNLDGVLLGQHQAEELAKRSSVKQGMAIALGFFERRFELEKQKPYPAFQILPYEFNSQYWFEIDSQVEFDKLCDLALHRHSFVSIYELPKFLSKLDAQANYLSTFVCKYLKAHDGLKADELYVMASLLAECEQETKGWRMFVSTVCRYCENYTETERHRIYSGFQHKMQTGSWRVGTVPQEIIDAVKRAQDLLNNEYDTFLLEYRQWVLQCAKYDLSRAKENAEEELHDGA